MTNDTSLLNEFINESKEHLSTVEADFLALEKQGDSPDRELVNRIFRAVHTIKGSAGFFGLRKISDLSHRMETILAMVREGKLRPQRAHTDLLLEGVDRLNALIDDVEGSNSAEITELLARLSALIEGTAAPAALKDMKTVHTIAQTPQEPGFEVTEFDLGLLPKEQRYIYALTYQLDGFEKRHGKTPVQLISQLLKTGTILDGLLTGGAADLHTTVAQSGVRYMLLYATMVDSSLIEAASELGSENICSIDRNSISARPAAPAPGAVTAPATPIAAVPVPAQTPSPEPIPEAKREEQHAAVQDSVRIRLDILDRLMMLAGELVLVRNQQLMNVDRADPASRSIAQRLDIVTSDLQETIMRTRMQPIGTIFGKFSRIVRDLGAQLSKKIEIEMTGNEVELDKTILEALTDPLVHIIRNCCDHGIESPDVRTAAGKPAAGHISVRAFHEGGQTIVEICDDGKGFNVDALKRKAVEQGVKTQEELNRMGRSEVLSLAFLPGVSTAAQVTDVSGRGVGMDVVKTSVERMGGVIDLKTDTGKGTTLTLRLPLTLAIIPSLIVKTDGYRYAIPQINLEELVCLYDEDVYSKIEVAGNREVYRLRDLLLPMVRLSDVLQRTEPFDGAAKSAFTEQARDEREKQRLAWETARSAGTSHNWSTTFAVLKVGATRFGLIIDSVLGTEEIVVKPMHRCVKNLQIYSGATVLGDGDVALILDALGLARHAGIEFEQQDQSRHAETKRDGAQKRSLILFKNGEDEQFAVDMLNVKRIEKIEAKNIERTGGREFITIDGTSTYVLQIDRAIPVSACARSSDMFLLLPKNAHTAYGVLASRLIDIGEYEVALNAESYRQEGVLGTAIIKNRMTLMLDIDTLIRIAQPEWYATGA